MAGTLRRKATLPAEWVTHSEPLWSSVFLWERGWLCALWFLQAISVPKEEVRYSWPSVKVKTKQSSPKLKRSYLGEQRPLTSGSSPDSLLDGFPWHTLGWRSRALARWPWTQAKAAVSQTILGGNLRFTVWGNHGRVRAAVGGRCAGSQTAETSNLHLKRWYQHHLLLHVRILTAWPL